MSKFTQAIPLIAVISMIACGGETSSEVDTGDDAADSFLSVPPQLRETIVHFHRRRRHPLDPVVDHRLTIAVELPSGLRSQLEQLVLTAPDGSVLLDCDAERGRWGTDTHRLEDRYCMSDDVTEQQAGDGVYELSIVLADAARLDGQFKVTRAWATTDVEIITPVNVPFGTEIVTTAARPTLEWEDFESPEFRPATEKREIEVFVTKEVGQPSLPFFQELEAGETQTQPEMDLPGGEHRAAVMYRETRKRGPLILKRDSQTLVRFFTE